MDEHSLKKFPTSFLSDKPVGTKFKWKCIAAETRVSHGEQRGAESVFVTKPLRSLPLRSL